MRRLFLLVPAASAALMLTGCMAQGPFPSLAQRPAEREPIREPVRIAPEVASDPALLSRIAALVGQAREGERAFEAASAAAQSAARSAGPNGSDGWVAAQEQLSRLEASRAPTTQALGDLDSLRLERADMPVNDDDWSTLETALAQVQDLASAQHSRIDALRGLIGR